MKSLKWQKNEGDFEEKCINGPKLILNITGQLLNLQTMCSITII